MGHRLRYDACALRDVYLMLQTHTQNMYYLLLFHGNSGYANGPLCYFIRRLNVACLVCAFIWDSAVALREKSPPPVPPHVLMNFRGFPPGCGDSVADF